MHHRGRTRMQNGWPSERRRGEDRSNLGLKSRGSRGSEKKKRRRRRRRRRATVIHCIGQPVPFTTGFSRSVSRRISQRRSRAPFRDPPGSLDARMRVNPAVRATGFTAGCRRWIARRSSRPPHAGREGEEQPPVSWTRARRGQGEAGFLFSSRSHAANCILTLWPELR